MKMYTFSETFRGFGRSPLLVAAAVWCAGGLAGCSSEDERVRVLVYSPHGKEMLGAYEDLFEARHPDVDIAWIDMGGQDAYDRIRTERQNPQASVWWGGDGMTFDRAAREGLLDPYEPSWAGEAPAYAAGAGNAWYGTFLTPEVIMYNTRSLAMTGEAPPQDWDALLEEQWHDRIIVRYPLASSTMRTIFGAMILRQPDVEAGYAWLARLDRNVETYAADPTQLYLKLAREEGDVTLWNMPDTYIQSQDNGYPFGYIAPASGTPVLTDGIALVAGGPQPARARAFYEFVTSDSALVDQAHRFYRIPVRNTLADTELPEWMTGVDIEPMEMDWERLSREGPEWMQYWDENIKGRGPAWLADRGLE